MIKISNHNPAVKCYANGEREPLECISAEYAGFIFSIGPGDKCDASSVPRIAWRLVGAPTTGANLLAGVFHDTLYKKQTFDRETCDLIFHELLLELGKPKWQAWIMWKAVEVFGSSHY